MAEIVSSVYDIVYPSPATLQEISSIALTVQIWRWELKQYGLENIWEEFNPKGKSDQNVSLPDVISNLPTTIDYMIKKYHKILVPSMDQWVEFNFCHIFEFQRDDCNDMLKDFNDIACDFDGTVHYDRTAKRMLCCDRFSLDEKFKIACSYCFEDDIRQIWPSVESEIDLNKIDFGEWPQLYYWVRRIKNEMDKIPDQGDDSIEETMIHHNTGSRSAFEYFWKRISLEKQSKIARGLRWQGTPMGFYSRLIVPKLNEQQIPQFLGTEDEMFWFYEIMIRDEGSREYILPVWMCIKNNIEEITFKYLAEILAWAEDDLYIADTSEQASRNDEILTLCCDVWNSAADHLKRAAIQYLFDDERLLKSDLNLKLSKHREIRFLLAVLSNATLEERLKFWYNSWLNLLKSTRRTDFLRIMKLCLNEEQIREFKETTTSHYENIKEVIEAYFEKGYFQEVKDLVNLCCPDQNSRRVLYQKMLQLNFFYNILNADNVRKAKLMREFIEDAYANDPDFSTDFKTNILSIYRFISFIELYYLNEVRECFDIFASDEINKEKFVDTLRSYIVSGSMYEFYGEEVQTFLFWCVGKEDENEMIKFKQSISPDEVLRNMLRNGKRRKNYDVDPDTYEHMIEYPRTLKPFLSWYFGTPEEIKEFKIRLEDVFKWIAAPRKKVFW